MGKLDGKAAIVTGQPAASAAAMRGGSRGGRRRAIRPVLPDSVEKVRIARVRGR